MKLANKAISEGGTMAAVLNAANEIAVTAFLNKLIRFDEITKNIKEVMLMHSNSKIESIECIIEADAWARAASENLIQN